MDDLISRQAAIEKIKPWLKAKGYSEGELNMLKAVICELAFMPSAYTEEDIQNMQDLEQAELEKAFELGRQDAQPEIIRCKDCIDYLRPHGCGHIDGMATAQEDGYCSYAERRTDG